MVGLPGSSLPTFGRVAAADKQHLERHTVGGPCSRSGADWVAMKVSGACLVVGSMLVLARQQRHASQYLLLYRTMTRGCLDVVEHHITRVVGNVLPTQEEQHDWLYDP